MSVQDVKEVEERLVCIISTCLLLPLPFLLFLPFASLLLEWLSALPPSGPAIFSPVSERTKILAHVDICAACANTFLFWAFAFAFPLTLF